MDKGIKEIVACRFIYLFTSGSLIESKFNNFIKYQDKT